MAVKKSAKVSRFGKLNRRVSLSAVHVIIFATLFGAVGAYALMQSFAAPASKLVHLNGPSTVSLGSAWSLSAGGFKPNGSYNINILAGNYVAGGNYTSTGYYLSADSTGSLTVNGTADLPGEYKITVAEVILISGGKRDRVVTAGEGSFAVQ